MSSATLYIVATPIGNLQDVSQRVLATLAQVEVIAAEDTRNTRKLLTHFDIHKKVVAYHNFNEKTAAEPLLAYLRAGQDVALVSDAGYPLISDPGYILVQRVIAEGFKLTVVAGPNAALAALVASGLKTAHYLFYGFLNAKASMAKKELAALKDFPYTMIFYEAPHRIKKTLDLCLEVLGDREACIARELTKLHEEYVRGPLSKLATIEEYRGELVLVIAGQTEEPASVAAADLLEKVEELVAAGLRVKEACGQLAQEYGVSKKELYDLYVKK